MNEYKGEDLDIGPDSLMGDLIGEILGFLSFVAILYWVGDKLSELWANLTDKVSHARKRDVRVTGEEDYAAILRDKTRMALEGRYGLFGEVTWDFQEELDRQIELMRPLIRAVSRGKEDLEKAGLEVRLLDKRHFEIKTGNELVKRTGQYFDMLVKCEFLGDQIEVYLFDEETKGGLRAFEDVDSAMSFIFDYCLRYFTRYFKA